MSSSTPPRQSGFVRIDQQERIDVPEPAESHLASTPEALAHVSSDELILLLTSHGAKLVSNDERGGFLQWHNHLIFVRRTRLVDLKELRDALRLAELGP